MHTQMSYLKFCCPHCKSETLTQRLENVDVTREILDIKLLEDRPDVSLNTGEEGIECWDITRECFHCGECGEPLKNEDGNPIDGSFALAAYLKAQPYNKE